MPIQKLITSTVAQALDGTTDKDLLEVIHKASNELLDVIEMFDNEIVDEIKAMISNGELRDLASN